MELMSEINASPRTEDETDKVKPKVNIYQELITSAMFDRLIRSSAHFKHQQRGEPDLTDIEKLNILTDVLYKSPAAFLSRFGNFLNIDDLKCFDPYRNDYEVDFRLNELEEFFTHRDTIVKNRRYEAMKRLAASGDFFSYDEMKHRDPLLYEQMVGQYLAGEDVVIDKSDLRLSTILMSHIEMKQDNYVYEMQKEIQEGQLEENDSSDDDEISANDAEATNKDCHRLSSEQINELREEFLRTMQERFLMGKESAFDYSTVDYNTEYDPVTQHDRDVEDRYFSGSEDD